MRTRVQVKHLRFVGHWLQKNALRVMTVWVRVWEREAAMELARLRQQQQQLLGFEVASSLVSEYRISLKHTYTQEYVTLRLSLLFMEI